MSIKIVQQTLAAAGFYLGPIDGVWGPKTAAALDEVIARVQPPAGTLGTGLDAGFYQLLKTELIRDEDVKLKVYRCTEGKRTIGCGRNLDAVGIRPEETATLGITLFSCLNQGITYAQAMALLDADIVACERDLDSGLPWWRKLDPVRRRVLLNMCFNMGLGTAKPGQEKGLLSFTHTLPMIERGEYRAAAIGMRTSKWARQVGDRAQRLATMMETGA